MTEQSLRDKVISQLDTYTIDRLISKEPYAPMLMDTVDALMSLISNHVEGIEKAYGGCRNCYGKGYATAVTWAAGGRKKWKTSGPMQFCDCERGKQLKKHVEAEKLEARIEENQRVVDAIDKNHADKYPTIDEKNVLTCVGHGYAVACKTVKRNALTRIDSLNNESGDISRNFV